MTNAAKAASSPLLQPLIAQNHQGFGGDVLPADAVEFMQEHGGLLVDVRTQAEWQFVGVPKVEAPAKVVFIQWKLYPQFAPNPEFIAQLKASGASANTPLFFLCRTGGRSTDAAIAATAAGFSRCYNIASGFEGEPNAKGQRSSVNGWRAAGQAWEQQ